MRTLSKPVRGAMRAGKKTNAITIAFGESSAALAHDVGARLRSYLREYDPTVSVEQARHQIERLIPPASEHAAFEITIQLLDRPDRFGPTSAERLESFVDGFCAGWITLRDNLK